jgi:hypothetical protein
MAVYVGTDKLDSLLSRPTNSVNPAYSNHATASESFSTTNGYLRNSQHLQNPLDC